MGKIVVLAGETRRGEDSDITNQGSVVGLRYQIINVPLFGLGPSFMISHADVRLMSSNDYLVNQKYPVQDGT